MREQYVLHPMGRSSPVQRNFRFTRVAEGCYVYAVNAECLVEKNNAPRAEGCLVSSPGIMSLVNEGINAGYSPCGPLGEREDVFPRNNWRSRESSEEFHWIRQRYILCWSIHPRMMLEKRWPILSYCAVPYRSRDGC